MLSLKAVSAIICHAIVGGKVFGIRCAASFVGHMEIANLQPSTMEAIIYFNRFV